MKKFICKIGDKIRFGNLGTDPNRFNPLTYREAIVEELYPDLIKYRITKVVCQGVEELRKPGDATRGYLTRKFHKSFWLDTPMEDVFRVIEKAGV